MGAWDRGGSDRGYLIHNSLYGSSIHASLSSSICLSPLLCRCLSSFFSPLCLSFTLFDCSSHVCVCVCGFVCVWMRDCICMAGALWIKEQKLLTFRSSSSDTHLQKDDNIENKLMNSHTHTHKHQCRPVLENIPH